MSISPADIKAIIENTSGLKQQMTHLEQTVQEQNRQMLQAMDSKISEATAPIAQGLSALEEAVARL